MNNKIQTIEIVLSAMLILSGIASANLSSGVILSGATAIINDAIITISGNNPVSVERYITYSDAGATATDQGINNTSLITTTGLPISTTAIGSNMVTYNLTGISGNNVIATRTVNIIDTTAPDNVVLGSVSATYNSITLPWTEPNTTIYSNQDFNGTVITAKVSGTSTYVAGYNKRSIPKGTASIILSGLSPSTSYDVLIQSADDQEPIHPGDGS